ncbi:hypothetical protein BV22DRAFT_936571 [Leucogyrophana mollusca]|uniref:Uncharacterized protein n=1 Tax=Leucogyrophana mollusca TaxID=85980 RepID=A0ACB8AW17_9AGAM|nr:hypothetical protein BV22DRAFT_936571 [Leucogyrophana mollusca]
MNRRLASNSISALVFLCWEICITFKDEVELIWKKPWKSLVKWLFLVTRYVGLTSLIGSLYISFGGNHPEASCRGFLVMMVTTSQTLVSLVELIFALRVHALYDRDRRMALFLAFLVIAGFIVAVVGLSSTVPRTKFDNRCGVTHIDSPMASFSFVFTITEGILLLLTISRCLWTLQTTRQSAPVLTLLIRDGSLGFLVVTSVLLPMSIVMVADRGKFVSWVTPWVNAVLSAAVSISFHCLGYYLEASHEGMQIDHQYATPIPGRLSSTPSHRE